MYNVRQHSTLIIQTSDFNLFLCFLVDISKSLLYSKFLPLPSFAVNEVVNLDLSQTWEKIPILLSDRKWLVGKRVTVRQLLGAEIAKVPLMNQIVLVFSCYAIVKMPPCFPHLVAVAATVIWSRDNHIAERHFDLFLDSRVCNIVPNKGAVLSSCLSFSLLEQYEIKCNIS